MESTRLKSNELEVGNRVQSPSGDFGTIIKVTTRGIQVKMDDGKIALVVLGL